MTSVTTGSRIDKICPSILKLQTEPCRNPRCPCVHSVRELATAKFSKMGLDYKRNDCKRGDACRYKARVSCFFAHGTEGKLSRILGNPQSVRFEVLRRKLEACLSEINKRKNAVSIKGRVGASTACSAKVRIVKIVRKGALTTSQPLSPKSNRHRRLSSQRAKQSRVKVVFSTTPTPASPGAGAGAGAQRATLPPSPTSSSESAFGLEIWEVPLRPSPTRSGSRLACFEGIYSPSGVESGESRQSVLSPTRSSSRLAFFEAICPSPDVGSRTSPLSNRSSEEYLPNFKGPW